jgi:hypothetical protein
MLNHNNIVRPYASDLFGIYQPLLGWKSKQTMQKLADESLRVINLAVQELMRDALLEKLAVENRVVPLDEPTDRIIVSSNTEEEGRISQTNTC